METLRSLLEYWVRCLREEDSKPNDDDIRSDQTLVSSLLRSESWKFNLDEPVEQVDRLSFNGGNFMFKQHGKIGIVYADAVFDEEDQLESYAVPVYVLSVETSDAALHDVEIMARSDTRVTFQLCPLHDVSNGNMFYIGEDLLNVTGSILEQKCTHRHDFSTEPSFPQHVLDQFGIAQEGLCHPYMFAFSNGWAVGLTNDEYMLMKRCGDRFEFVAGFKDISSAYQLGDGGTSVTMRDSGCIDIRNGGDVSSSVVIRLPAK